MKNKDSWPKPANTENSRDIDLEELEDKLAAKRVEEERLAMEAAEQEAEVLNHPPRTFITAKQLINLRKDGEVKVTGIYLYGRQLKPKEKVILLDENMTEIPTEFVEITSVGDEHNGMSIKVRLPDIDNQPQPSKDPEIISAQQICAEMREIVKKLPQPSSKMKEQAEEQQFGNNFYFLFIGIEAIKLNPNSPVVEHYLRKAEKLYGEKWKKFLQDNVSLLAQIREALAPLKLLFQLSDRFHKLLFNSKTRDIATQINDEINIEGITMVIWDKLNPLLKQASDAMVLCGIKPEDFYG